MRDRLLALGRWLDVNGDAIYATRPGPATGSCTQRTTISKDGTVNVIEEGRPGAELQVEPVIEPGADSEVTLLGSDGAPLATRTEDGHLIVTLPGDAGTEATGAYVVRITNATATVRPGTTTPDCEPAPPATGPPDGHATEPPGHTAEPAGPIPATPSYTG